MSLIDKIAAQLAPHTCLGCGTEGELLCPVCLWLLPKPPMLALPAHLDQAKVFTVYSGLAKQLIWKLKFSGAQAAAITMAKAMVSLIPLNDKPTVVSVPTATSRVRQRGYDQAQLLGRQLARQAGLRWLDCLARSGQLHQVGANRQQRRQQLHSSLRVTQPHFVHGAHLLLVDDVMTTGATLEAAAKLLKSAGASRVDALTFAYTSPK